MPRMRSGDVESRFAMVARRAGAPRLLDWTGERCVPWSPDAQVVYEHLHRYLWAAAAMPGRRVLDLASGEGFGAAILATVAQTVVGVDVDKRSVAHSRLNYGAPNLSFAVGDARDLKAVADDSFDAVVAFEMIEHVDDQDRVLGEIRRVLTGDGLLVMSTPEREAYAQASGDNPFHVRELSRGQLDDLLRSRFAHTAVFAQRAITGSAMAAIDDGTAGREHDAAAESLFVEPVGDEWRVLSQLSPLYLVALASDAALPTMPPHSTLGDPKLTLLRGAEARTAAAEARTAVAELDTARARDELSRATGALNEARELAERELAQLRAQLQTRADELRASHEELARLGARAGQDATTIAGLDAAYNDAQQKLRRVEDSVTWQGFQRVRGRAFAALGGEDSAGVRALQYLLRSIGGAVLSGRRRASARSAVTQAQPRAGAPRFPVVQDPDVSIVMPLYARAELTRAALWSILDHSQGIGYEVVLVDDSEDPPTKALLEQTQGARVIANPSNLGYLKSIQRGAEAAKGRWLVLCNNDIEAQPGWLSALLDCGESHPDVAIVAPKFLAPDGSLSEAGAIVWRDGTGANYGRGDNPSICHYEYSREVDYGSAAALMVRTAVWRGLGGYDERFAPMYYEDTDLCFQARSQGLRVMYEPRARVLHAEGSTAGVDLASGHKRHQDRNRAKFADKWRPQLQREHLENDARNLWLAANLRRHPRCLVVDHRVPTWDRDSGGMRMRGVMAALLQLGCHVTLLPDNLFPAQPYTRELQRMGVEVLYGIDPNEAIATIGPALSLVILSRPSVASRWLPGVREHAAAAAVAFDTVDLHWLREARRDALARGGDVTNGNALSDSANAMRELELALVRATDATLVVTDEERALVARDVPQAMVRVVPNVNELAGSVAPAQYRNGIIFVGGFEHPPNLDAALSLVRDVMPLVWRELADVPVKIVGADPPPEVQALGSELVEVTGWVPELGPLLASARVLLAPLTYGAGMKGKVTQALACGLPVVTTPTGAEGLDAVHGEHMLVGDTPQALAEMAVAALRDDHQWARLSEGGRRLAAAKCSPAVMLTSVRDLLGELVGQPTPPAQLRAIHNEPPPSR